MKSVSFAKSCVSPKTVNKKSTNTANEKVLSTGADSSKQNLDV